MPARQTLVEWAGGVRSKAEKQVRTEVDISALVQGYRGQRIFGINGDETITMGTSAFSALMTDYIGVPGLAATFSHFNKHPELQVNMLQAVVEDKQVEDKQIYLLSTDGGSHISAVLSGQYVVAPNLSIAMALQGMVLSGHLPENTYVHRSSLTNNGLDLYARFISDDWTHDIGIPGRTDIARGGLIVYNNSTGQGAFRAGAGLARVSCWNWLLAESIIKVSHQFSTWQDFHQALSDAVTHVNEYSAQIATQVRELHGIEFNSPVAVFEQVARDMNLPIKAQARAREYWTQETDQATAFDVVQAITSGAQSYSDVSGRQAPRWHEQSFVEQTIIAKMDYIHQIGETAYAQTVEDVIGKLSEYSPAALVSGIGDIIPEGDQAVRFVAE